MNINIQVDMHSTMSLFGIDYRGEDKDGVLLVCLLEVRDHSL